MKLSAIIGNVKLTVGQTERSTTLSRRLSTLFQGQQKRNSTDLESCSPIFHVPKAERVLTL